LVILAAQTGYGSLENCRAIIAQCGDNNEQAPGFPQEGERRKPRSSMGFHVGFMKDAPRCLIHC
jgi:hypothetical protein